MYCPPVPPQIPPRFPFFCVQSAVVLGCCLLALCACIQYVVSCGRKGELVFPRLYHICCAARTDCHKKTYSCYIHDTDMFNRPSKSSY